MHDFDREILQQLEAAFKADELQVLCFMPDSGGMSHAVKVIHKPPGIETVGDAFYSQIQNKATALAELLGRLREL